MVLPLIAAAVAVKVGSKIAKKVAKGAYRVAKSDTVRNTAKSVGSKAIKSKQAKCAAKASIAKIGTKRATYRSCMNGKPAKKRK